MPIKLPKTLTEAAADRLRRMIITAELKFGSPIIEGDLADRFGLSKTPVREALLILKKEGLVEVRPRKGTFVFAPSERDIHDLMDARRVLEPGALRYAMERNPIRLLRDMEQNLELSEQAVAQADTLAYLKLDRQFHALLFRHADNPHLNTFSAMVSAQMQAIRYRLAFNQGFMTRSIDAHKIIFGHLQAGDLAAATDRLTQHVQSAIHRDTIRQLVEEGKGSC